MYPIFRGFSLVLVLLLFPASAFAESAPVQNRTIGTARTELLPGEKVITPTGQELRVWSTRGPVPVSRAPEPFEDKQKSVLQNTHVVIDAVELRKDIKDKPPSKTPSKKLNDSFDVRDQK